MGRVPLDRPMVLLDDVVEVFDLTDHDLLFQAIVEIIDRRLVGAALVHCDLLGLTMQAHGLVEKAPGRCLVALGRQQVVDRAAVLVHCAVQVFPDGRLILPAQLIPLALTPLLQQNLELPWIACAHA